MLSRHIKIATYGGHNTQSFLLYSFQPPLANVKQPNVPTTTVTYIHSREQNS